MQEMPVQGSVIFNSVYFIECSEVDAPYIRHSTAPLAIRPLIDLSTHQARWGTNSSRGDYISWDEIKPKIDQLVVQQKSSKEEPILLEDSPQEIRFSKGNHILKLVRLTVELFDQKVRSGVAAGETLTFSNNEDLQTFFLSGDFEK